MAIKLTTYSNTVGLDRRITVRLTRLLPEETDDLAGAAFVLPEKGDEIDVSRYRRFVGIVTDSKSSFETLGNVGIPVVLVPSTKEFGEGHIVTIEPKSGFVRTIFRPESPHNTIFTTDRCNSNCLMCSQPPKEVDDSYLVDTNLKMLSLIKSSPEYLGITGGEPTLLGPDLIRLLETARDRLPNTHIHMLTNGRLYKDLSFVRRIASIKHPSFVSAIPLYADVAGIHDYIVQAKGAFDETVEGLYNAAEAGLAVEIRIVLHKQSIPRLCQLAQFIYWNFPFAVHVAFMGLENMGYVKKNWDELWIDPVEYMDTLSAAVRYLYLRRMNISIYNLQLCLIPPSLWSFARKSISDFKNEYLDICSKCTVKNHCAGLFLSQLKRHSQHIQALSLEN
jgi:His-Xaa-Ser system radical SAM maturase HxsC